MKIFRVSTVLMTIIAMSAPGMSASDLRDRMLTPDSLANVRWEIADSVVYNAPASDNTAEIEWWGMFDDPILDSLLVRGVENNYNVAMAARRMEIARQTLNQARSLYFPEFGLSLGWSKSRTSGARVSSGTPATNSSAFTAGVDMSWQIDLFGKITAGVKQRRSQWRASRAEYDGAMLTLRANIASAYIQLRLLQAEMDVTRAHMESQKGVYDMAKARFEAGLASKLDVAQAATVYYQTLATTPALESAIESTLNSLTILMGEMPGSMDRLLTDRTEIPNPGRILGAGMPMELIRRRPDIAGAEAQVAAAAEALGIARKDYLPTLTLNGSIGTAAHRAGDLFKRNALEYSIAPTLSWTIFDGMARKYGVISAREQMEAEIDNYNLTVITAVSDVDNALAGYKSAMKQIDYYAQVVEQSKKALDKSVDLFRSGLASFSDVEDSQLNYLNYTNSWLEARAKAATALVSLYEALGGGWTADHLG